MSHGPVGEDVSADPNLTPLLDLVMQLLMFFMVCADFKQRDREQVHSPVSFAAVPGDAGAIDPSSPEKEAIDSGDILTLSLKPFKLDEYTSRFVNRPEVIDELSQKFRTSENEPPKNCVLLYIKGLDRDPPYTMNELTFRLRRLYEDLKDRSPDGKVKTVAVIRADGDIEFGEVYRMMQMAEEAGFKIVGRVQHKQKKSY